jgi:di/tricarboxylate transporter
MEIESLVSGFSNTSIITIFLLIIITGGINENFNVAGAFAALFKGVTSARSFLLRMSLAVAGFSAFMNNTPVVAVMMPHVYSWGRKYKVSPSKLLMPLSFAAIVGGVITLIGTSTNLVLNGLITQSGRQPLAFFDFLIPGLIISFAVIIVMVILAPVLLKSNPDFLQKAEANERQYIVEIRVPLGSNLRGQSVEKAGLRNLSGAFLTEIIRHGKTIAAVGPDELLEENDVLLFAGDNASIIDLAQSQTGLELAKTSQFNLIKDTTVVECIVAQNSYLDRKSAKEVGFRELYDAAIIGIHRKGEKLSGKIGSVDLRTGDVLLLIAGSAFEARNRSREDLIIINSLPQEVSLPKKQKLIFGLGTVLSILLSVFGLFSLFESLALIALLQLSTGMLKAEQIKKSISIDLLVILIAALAIGNSLISSGAAEFLSNLAFANASSWSPLAILVGVFAFSFLLTSFVTNVAAISITFPVILSLASQISLPAEALFLTAAYGASCCFITPYAYQTNLMVLELGNYRFSDYFKLGFFVSLIYAIAFFVFIYFKFLI